MRQYQRANDSYLRLSIGNAPWPIGVTMVGCAEILFATSLTYIAVASIHERSAREKISSDQVAHVLNDEVSRKYIQSLKRYVYTIFVSEVADTSQTFDICPDQVSPRRCFAVDGVGSLLCMYIISQTCIQIEWSMVLRKSESLDHSCDNMASHWRRRHDSPAVVIDTIQSQASIFERH